MSVQSPRRVSYVLPPPTSPPPILSLPPLGITRVGRPGPFYSQVDPVSPSLHPHSASKTEEAHLRKFTQGQGSHPRHRLAVQALTIDLSTSLSSAGGGASGKNAADAAGGPAGILYTGGRDGLVCSWELGMPSKKRRFRYGREPVSRNDYDSESSASADGDDDDDDEEEEEEVLRRTHESLGEEELNGGEFGNLPPPGRWRKSSGGRRSRSESTRRPFPREGMGEEPIVIPVEERWEVDDERIKSIPPPSARFRQCVQSHTDVRPYLSPVFEHGANFPSIYSG